MSRASRAYIGKKLGEGIGAGLEKAGQKYVERKEDEEDAPILEKLSDPNLPPIERASLSAKLSKRGQQNYYNYLLMERRLESFKRGEQELKFKTNREKRLDVKDIERRYNQKIKELQNEINDTIGDPEKKEELREKRNSLMEERDLKIAKIQSGIETPDITSEAEEIIAPGTTEVTATSEQPAQKIKWDPSNPEHIQFAQAAQMASMGNRNMANALISQRFER